MPATLIRTLKSYYLDNQYLIFRYFKTETKLWFSKYNNVKALFRTSN